MQEINSYLWFFFVVTAAIAIFFKKSRFFLLLIYFLLPAVRVEGDLTETFHDPLIQARWAALAGMVVINGVSAVLGGKALKKLPSFFLYFIPFFLCILISVSYSANSVFTFFKVASIALLFLGIYFEWFCKSEPRAQLFSFIIKNLLIYNVLVILLNVLSVNSENAFFRQFGYFRGIFANPNTIGLLTGVFCIPSGFYALVTQKSPVKKGAALVFLCVSSAMLWQSYSRAGVLSALVSVFAFSLFYFKKRWMFFVIAGMIGIGSLVYETKPQFFQGFREEWVLKNRKPQEGVLSSRINPWTESLSKARNQLLTGYGFGMVADFSESWESQFQTEASARPRGSSFVALLEEVGVVGLFCFLIPLLYLINPIRILRLKESLPKPDFGKTLLFYSILLAGFTNALLEDWLLSVGWLTTILFWNIAAASVCFGKEA